MEENNTAQKPMPTFSPRQKIKRVKTALMRNLTFLQNYLPYANSHSKDFLIHRHWEEFLPEEIRKELLSMTEENLISLPVLKNTGNVESNPQDVCEEDWNFHCEYFDKSMRVKNKYDIYSEDMKQHPPHWVHRDVKSFVAEAHRQSLECCGLLSSWDELAWRLRGTRGSQEMFISQYMNHKKSHEVEVMGDVCAELARSGNADMVVDLGSGKGYLSTHLALQHDLTVLGVDAQNTNTEGAVKRSEVLSRQWNGLTRNAKLKEQMGDKKKLGKKLKKKMKKLEHEQREKGHKDARSRNSESEGQINYSKGQGQKNCLDVAEEILEDVGDLIAGFLLDDSDVSKGRDENITKKIKDHNETGHVHVDGQIDKQSITFNEQHIKDLSLNVKHTQLDCIDIDNNSCSEIPSDSLQSNDRHTDAKLCTDCDTTLNKDVSSRNKKVKKSNRKDQCKNLFPVTLYIDSNTDMINVIRDAFKSGEQCHLVEISGNTCLLLTGLHTCGGLGSSMLRLFASCQQAKILCNVGCCYHLMDEEFVANPYRDKEQSQELEGSHSGFPLSSLLIHHGIGLGRLARSFASQAVTRRGLDSKLIARQFPRALLQAVLSDILGYVSDDWKGLRRLDQRSTDMLDYILQAVKKLGLPEEKFTTPIVRDTLAKYEGYERKFLAFFRLKLVLAPCIEAVVLLDRLLYLLEQDCVEDAMLIQMFDPLQSPRCHAIIAFKKNT